MAWRGKDAAWGRLRRVWGCSPREESDRDGPGQEIDGEVCSWGKTEVREIGAARKTSGGAAQLGVLGGGEASSWRPIYRRWKAVERGEGRWWPAGELLGGH